MMTTKRRCREPIHPDVLIFVFSSQEVAAGATPAPR
ncbi:hypothetical protein F4559_001549 [Saccharothrix violaceirubra]|uniref:Uncharacterized protein n=1 Tax=Saccharothrix violaceirubra TaxID=413306 RepID=A0A7W7WUD3_9PSEU|nr:hypothetical protein [Saccharothrix violaceirubra]